MPPVQFVCGGLGFVDFYPSPYNPHGVLEVAMSAEYMWTAYGLNPTPEYRFAPPRKWRFDWAFVDKLVAVEIDGGVWTGGRHTRGSGFIGDMQKMNEAGKRGWRVFRFTPQEYKKGIAQSFMVEVFKELK